MQKKFMIAMLLLGSCFNTLWSQSLSAAHPEPSKKKEQKVILTGGPVLEANLSGFIRSGSTEHVRSEMKFGFSAGGFLDLGISKSFSVQGEMLFHHKTSGFSVDNQVGNYGYWGMEIPVFAMYHHCFAKGNRLHIGIGPYTEFGLGASYKYNGTKKDLYEKDQTTGTPALRDSNTGFGIKVGYEWVSGLQINATYKGSVTNLVDKNSSIIKIYPQSISLGIAYRFGKTSSFKNQ